MLKLLGTVLSACLGCNCKTPVICFSVIQEALERVVVVTHNLPEDALFPLPQFSGKNTDGLSTTKTTNGVTKNLFYFADFILH